jgi:hypothetical protein
MESIKTLKQKQIKPESTKYFLGYQKSCFTKFKQNYLFNFNETIILNYSVC